MCCKPIASSAVCRFPCQAFWNSHYLKISVSSSHTLPLLPYTHTYSVIETSVNVVHVILHACNSIVVKPSSCITSYLFLSISISLFSKENILIFRGKFILKVKIQPLKALDFFCVFYLIFCQKAHHFSSCHLGIDALLHKLFS